MNAVREVLARVLRLLGLRHQNARRFRLRDASFGKGGLVGDLSWGDWGRIRELSYERDVE